MEKIKGWAVSLQDVLLQMAKQMQVSSAVYMNRTVEARRDAT